MRKAKSNLTLGSDIIVFVKFYAEEQRTMVSEVIGQFILNLKRVKEHDTTKTILVNPDFSKV